MNRAWDYNKRFNTHAIRISVGDENESEAKKYSRYNG